MARSSSLSEMRSVVIGVLLLSSYAFWEAWLAISSGDMANISCTGSFSKRSCAIGSSLGRALFGAQNEHWGYALVHVLAGVFLTATILRLYLREREKLLKARNC